MEIKSKEPYEDVSHFQ